MKPITKTFYGLIFMQRKDDFMLKAPPYYSFRKIRFNGDSTIYMATVYRYSANTYCEIIFDQEYVNVPADLQVLDTSYFELLTDDEVYVYGKFSGYNTIYMTIENGFILSNDGSVYEEPEEPVETEPEEVVTEEQNSEEREEVKENGKH